MEKKKSRLLFNAIAMALLLCFALPTCGIADENESGIAIGKRYLNDDNGWHVIEYPYVELTGDNVRNGVLERFEEINEEFREYVESICALYGETAENYPAATVRLYVARADDTLISLLQEMEVGEKVSYYAYNLDAATGEEISADNVILDYEAVEAKVREKLADEYGIDVEFGSLEENLAETALTWTVGNEGITLYFGSEYLTTGNETQQVTITYTECPQALSADYAFMSLFSSATASYTFQAAEGQNCYLEQVGNVTVEGKMDEYGTWTGITVVVNGIAQEYETYGYNMACTLIADNHQYYLAAEADGDSGSDTLYLFLLEESGAELLGTAGETSYTCEIETDDGDFACMTQAIVDPKNMVLETRTDAFGTGVCFRTYCLGGNGTLLPQTDYYTVKAGNTLKTKTAAEADVVDEAGGVIGKATVEPGTELTIFRTDNETYVDLYDFSDEGRILRVYADLAEYPYVLQSGENPEDVFEGIVYAG